MSSTYSLSALRFVLVPVFFILILSYLQAVLADCPHICECKWKSGKESVLCLHANLTFIPARLDGGTQVLDLTGNQLSHVSNDVFATNNLLNLQKIFLSRCRVKIIEKFAFRKLNNLVELDLSYNMLTTIPDHIFDSISELREIKLSGNPIHKVSNDAFTSLQWLMRLELSDCRISHIDSRGFFGLEASLEWLKLDGNKLIEINPTILTSFKNLHDLELARNPWNCSCNLRSLRFWMVAQNIPFAVSPICKFPQRLYGKSWDKIDLDEFACLPRITSVDSTASGMEGENVTLSCKMEGIPQPNSKWILKNRVVANLSDKHTITLGHGRQKYVASFTKNTSNITILSLEAQDTGIYICAAENQAGCVELEISLVVLKKQTELTLGTKVFSVCSLIGILLILSLIIYFLGVWTVKKRKGKCTRWNKNTGTESYEKIEMNRQVNYCSSFTSNDDSHYVRPLGDNAVAIVHATKKNGDYSHLPTDDDIINCEENENSACSILSWQYGQKSLKLRNTAENIPDEYGVEDLHIPRLIEFSSNPDSSSSSLSSQAIVNMTRGYESSPSLTQLKLAWTNQANYPNSSTLLNTETKIRYNESETDFKKPVAFNKSIFSSGFCENEKTYPDLIDISLIDVSKLDHRGSHTNVFCTLPRKRKQQSNKYFQRMSESQSPLLRDNESKYNSNGTSNSSLSSHFYGRRSSDVSRSIYQMSEKNGIDVLVPLKSNSFLNLIHSGSISQSIMENPSLPTSPVHLSQKTASNNATPLLDFTSLPQQVQYQGNLYTGIYDYHSLQLARFLEEYRNLQQQLCKMKETCDSIRQKRIHIEEKGINAVECPDQVLCNTTFESQDVISNRLCPEQAFLKTSDSFCETPDPPPYWLHRNNMIKRLSGSKL